MRISATPRPVWGTLRLPLVSLTPARYPARRVVMTPPLHERMA
jgi:hypothetical protein